MITTFGLMKRAIQGPLERGLVMGMGSGSFSSTGWGGLSAPTTTLGKAFDRNAKRIREREPGRNVEVRGIP